MVTLEIDRNFIIADIPGLIKGAAQGVGLGTRFLKHLSRTRLLLHLVDIAPLEGEPIQAIQDITQELENYSPALATRERWLIFNKIDLLPPDEQQQYCQTIIQALNWQAPTFQISALTGQGCWEVCYEIMNYLEKRNDTK